MIAALRHVHMTPKDAARFGVEDGQYIQTEIDGLRGAILCNVLVRVSDKYALEMHIDVEEANALGVKKRRPGPFSLTIEPGRRQGRGGPRS